jgi:hypothetical protein
VSKVKIGKRSHPVDVRSKEFDNTAIPLPFTVLEDRDMMKPEDYNLFQN